MNQRCIPSLFVAAVAIGAAAVTCSPDEVKGASRQYELYLLIGQSNMAGRGKTTAADRKPHPRVFKFSKRNAWVPATAPLHFDKPRIAGVGPGDGFGRAMAEAEPQAKIGLVPCAVGGTPLRRWVKGGDLYENAVKRARSAMKQGTLKGVIWHQGESDSRSEKTAGTYAKRLAAMIGDLRKDLNSPQLPFVAGELGRFLNRKRLPHWESVNAAINSLPKTVPHVAVVDSKGLKAKKDGVHFDAESAREFGRRYAAAMLKLQSRKTALSTQVVFVTETTGKLDDGLDKNADARYPIFVRMTDQLFDRGGAYEKFAKENAASKRRELRPKVIKELKRRADASWKAVGPVVAGLEKTGDVEGRQRYWIVNGFACTATYQACEKLAALGTVSFIYRQRGAAPLQRRAVQRKIPAERQRQMKAVYEQVLKDFQDDSGKAVKTEGVEIPWNVKRIRADVAWTREKATGAGVVIGLMDSGLMVTPSLTAALWKNPGEKLNGKDDDGNGYVDDLFGYDFAANSFYALGDGARRTHGSMCGGIIAGRPLNSRKLATGIAPRAKLMVLRGMGLLKAYEYAIEQGADIVSMSFMFIRRPLGNYRGVYRLAHEHMAACGVVAVGGAGNFNRPGTPKGKQIAVPKDIPCVIAAAGILKNGTAAGFSSRGPVFWNGVKFYDDYPPDKPLRKPDVTGCIGGFPVWGRPVRFRNWQVFSKESNGTALVVGPRGNSFSGPHAAGVAALMLSVNPDLNVWDVKRLMEATCRDLGDKGWDTTYGHGLLDAVAAVKAARKHR